MANTELGKKSDASTFRRILKAREELNRSIQPDPLATTRRIQRSLFGVPSPTSPEDTKISDQVITRHLEQSSQSKSRSGS